MSKFKLYESVRYKKHSGVFIISGIDEQSTSFRQNETVNTNYSITNKSEYENWNPEDENTIPKIVFHNVGENDLVKL